MILADRTFSQNQLFLRPNRASRVGPMNSGARRGDPIDRALGQRFAKSEILCYRFAWSAPKVAQGLARERELVRRFEHNSRRESEREKIFLFFWR
jgi:hypothetical protein